MNQSENASTDTLPIPISQKFGKGLIVGSLLDLPFSEKVVRGQQITSVSRVVMRDPVNTDFLPVMVGQNVFATFGWDTPTCGSISVPLEIDVSGSASFSNSVFSGDINGDGQVNLLDIGPFLNLITNGNCDPAGDTNCDGVISLLDVGPFVDLITGC